jgi:hypothetical protein
LVTAFALPAASGLLMKLIVQTTIGCYNEHGSESAHAQKATGMPADKIH